MVSSNGRFRLQARRRRRRADDQRAHTQDKPSVAMSGRQYNMYNSQTAEAWKQRVMKENLHNAPSLRVFADLADDDDNQSVSSMGSRATGMTRASVATSRASVASTAALNRVRDLTPLPERIPLSSASICSYIRHTSNPLVSPTHRHVSRASSQLHAHSARYFRTVAAHHPL